MPKTIYKIDDFSIGKVSSLSPRDIPDGALVDAINIMVDKKGRVDLMGSAYAHRDFAQDDLSSLSVSPGYGLFVLHHDYEMFNRLVIDNVGPTTALAGTDKYKVQIDTTTNHNLDTGAAVYLYGTASGNHDGQFVIEKIDANSFYIISTNGTADGSGSPDGYVRSGKGNFKSIFFGKNGVYNILPVDGDAISGFNEASNAKQPITLALGANMGGLTDFTSSADDNPVNWSTAKIDYSYFFDSLRIFNSNISSSREAGDLEAYDWPTWLGFIDQKKWFVDKDGADLDGTVEWVPGWYQTLAHPMSPLEWASYRNFRNRHDGITGTTFTTDSHSDSLKESRATASFVYAYPSGTATQSSLQANFDDLEHNTALSNNGTAGLTLLPGQFCVRMYTSSEAGAWSKGTKYKFGYSYYYDANADADRPQDSEIHYMGSWNSETSINPTNHYIGEIQDGILNLSGAGTDSLTSGNNTFFDPDDDTAIEMQVYINTGGSHNFTNEEKSLSDDDDDDKSTKLYWPPRMRGIRVWVVGTLDANNNLSQEAEPTLLMEIDFEKGVRLNGNGEYSPYEAVTGNGIPDGDFNGTEEDHKVKSGLLISTEPPSLSYRVINERYHNQSFNAVKWKTDTSIGTTRYIGNFIADYGVSGYPHNCLDSTKRRLVTHSDSICRSIASGPDIFPEEHIIPVGEANDGEEIVKLISLGFQLLVFKTETLYLYSTEQGEEVLVGSYPYMGLTSSEAITRVEKGLAWVNKNGMFLYDGENMANVVEGKIHPDEWKSFIGEDPILGYIPTKKQIVVFESGVSSLNKERSYIYDVVNSAWTEGEDITKALPKSNLVSNYNNELLFVSPNVDNIHDIDIYNTGETTIPSSSGTWVIKGAGNDLTWSSSKLTIKSTDITDVFSYAGDNSLVRLKTEIDSKSQAVEGHQAFNTQIDEESGTLTITWDLSQEDNSTFNASNLNGSISITNAPTGDITPQNKSYTGYNVALLDASDRRGGAELLYSAAGESTGSESMIVNQGCFLFVRRKQANRLPLGLARIFGQFTLSDPGSMLLNDAEDDYIFKNTISGVDSHGGQIEQPYVGYISPAWATDWIGIAVAGSPFSLSDKNGFTVEVGATMALPTIAIEPVPGFASAQGYLYFSDYTYISNLSLGHGFGLSGTSYNNADVDSLWLQQSEIIEVDGKSVGRARFYEFGEDVYSQGNIVKESFLSSDTSPTIIFTGSSGEGVITNSCISTHDISIPVLGTGDQYYIAPNRHGDHDDTVTYVLNVRGNNGKTYQFQRTRAANEISSITLDHLKADLEEANLEANGEIFLGGAIGETTNLKKPSVELAVDFDNGDATIITNGNTSLRAYEDLLQPGAEFTVGSDAVDAGNRGNFVVSTFVKGSSTDTITIDATVNTCGGDIDLNLDDETNDTVTITFQALLIKSHLDPEYPLQLSANVYKGVTIYKFDNIPKVSEFKNCLIRTKDIDLGAPGVRKNLISVLVTAKNMNGISLNYYKDGDSTKAYPLIFKGGDGSGSSFANNEEYNAYEFVPEVDSDGLLHSKNLYSFMLEFKSTQEVSGFSINDISIIYRSKGVR